MRQGYRNIASLILGSVFVVGSIGCASHSGVRVYDPYRNDYHRWNNHETVYYNQWVVEDHRDHRDYKDLNKDDQRRYWEWRHQHHRR